jgi:hypothetical protein
MVELGPLGQWRWWVLVLITSFKKLWQRLLYLAVEQATEEHEVTMINVKS